MSWLAKHAFDVSGPKKMRQFAFEKFVIPDKQERATKSSDFELVTRLVIKGNTT